MGDKGRWQYLRAIYGRYRTAGRKAKRVILNEFCANTDYNRKYAIRLLNGPRPEKHLPERRGRRGVSYTRETVAVLTAIWEAAGYPWSVRLKALLPQWMPWIRRRFALRPESTLRVAEYFLEVTSIPITYGPSSPTETLIAFLRGFNSRFFA